MYFSSFSFFKTLSTIFDVLFIRNFSKAFSNSTYSDKYKAFEPDNHLLPLIGIFEHTVYIAISISEPGLKF